MDPFTYFGRMKQLALEMNWTPGALVLILLAMFIVEGFRIMGRQSAPNVERTKFSLRDWLSQFSNWFGLVLSVACSLSLLAIRDGFIQSIGLEIADRDVFPLFWAFGVGAFGQAIMKIVLKAFMGMFGAYSGDPK